MHPSIARQEPDAQVAEILLLDSSGRQDEWDVHPPSFRPLAPQLNEEWSQKDLTLYTNEVYDSLCCESLTTLIDSDMREAVCGRCESVLVACDKWNEKHAKKTTTDPEGMVLSVEEAEEESHKTTHIVMTWLTTICRGLLCLFHPMMGHCQSKRCDLESVLPSNIRSLRADLNAAGLSVICKVFFGLLRANSTIVS